MDSLVKLAGSELLAERKDFGGDAFCPISFVGWDHERSQRLKSPTKKLFTQPGRYVVDIGNSS
jgi:hypothetical protein